MRRVTRRSAERDDELPVETDARDELLVETDRHLFEYCSGLKGLPLLVQQLRHRHGQVERHHVARAIPHCSPPPGCEPASEQLPNRRVDPEVRILRGQCGGGGVGGVGGVALVRLKIL